MPLPDPILVGRTRDFGIGVLFDSEPIRSQYPGERLLLSLALPPWQRPEVWTQSQKIAYVEGLFLGFGAGTYVVNGSDWGQDGERLPKAGWILDGQQRISALRDFVQNGLVIFDDVVFGDLTEPQRQRFMRKPFVRFELDYTEDDAVLREIYDRLNFGGTAHEEHERASEYAREGMRV